MADLARLHEVAEDVEGLLDRVRRARLRRGGRCGVRAPGHRPVGPMELVEVDIVGLQAPEALVDRLLDLRAGQFARRAVVPEPGHARSGRSTLVARITLSRAAAALEPGADDALGRALRLGARRDRVEFRGVEEVDALRRGRSPSARGPRPPCSAGPRSWCRGRSADVEAGAAEGAVLHEQGSSRPGSRRVAGAGTGASEARRRTVRAGRGGRESSRRSAGCARR